MEATDRALAACRVLLGGSAATYADLQSALGVGRRSAQRWVGRLRERFGADFRERERGNGEKVFWIEGRKEWLRRLRERPPTGAELAALAAACAEGHRVTPAERAALAALRHRLGGPPAGGPRREAT